MNELRRKLDSCDEISRMGLQRRLCMLGATCFSTFDVCPEHTRATLASEDDFSIAMQCAVTVHDNRTSALLTAGNDSLHLNRILSRHHRLLHQLEPIFGESFPPGRGKVRLLHGEGYNDALAKLWLGYQPSNAGWYMLPRPNSRWVSCVAETGQRVYYNLLTGELLVGGKRLGQLPQEIVQHPTYQGIFGAVSGQIKYPHLV
jgi:hypothetical protein